MTPFTPEQWIIVILVFLLGLFFGMYLLAGPKWKRRHRTEVARRQELEAENARLRSETSEMHSLRGAAARHPAERTTDRPL